jgi:hypothetical protein
MFYPILNYKTHLNQETFTNYLYYNEGDNLFYKLIILTINEEGTILKIIAILINKVEFLITYGREIL